MELAEWSHKVSLWRFVVLGLVSGWIFLTGCEMFKTKYEDIPAEFPAVDQIEVLDTLTFDYSVVSMAGETIPLDDFRGKVLFVNIWGTWCGPCVVELPGLQKLYESVGSKDIAFLFLSDEPMETVRSFLDQNGYSIPAFTYANPLPPAIAASSFPTTHIIDKEGRVVFRYNRTAKWNDESTVKFLNSLISEAAAY